MNWMTALFTGHSVEPTLSLSPFRAVSILIAPHPHAETLYFFLARHLLLPLFFAFSVLGSMAVRFNQMKSGPRPTYPRTTIPMASSTLIESENLQVYFQTLLRRDMLVV